MLIATKLSQELYSKTVPKLVSYQWQSGLSEGLSRSLSILRADSRVVLAPYKQGTEIA